MGGPHDDQARGKHHGFPDECTVGLVPRRRYLIGVSGGCDSVALLHWLSRDKGFKNLVVCHLNHGLRGRESGGDAAFVRRLASSHDLDFEIEKTDVRRLAAVHFHGNLEAAGRAARLSFYGRAARKHRCRRVLLAHHADDQVETFLMRLFRGAGTEGLAGMRRETEMKIDGIKTKLTVYRPLLAVPRVDLEAYAASENLRYRSDSSNADPGFLRNRLRANLIPSLEAAFGREVKPLLLRTLTNLQDERELLAVVTNQALDSCRDHRGGKTGRLLVRQLRHLDIRLRRRVVWQWLRDHQVSDLSRKKVEEVLAISDPRSSAAKCNLSGDRFVRRQSGRLFLE